MDSWVLYLVSVFSISPILYMRILTALIILISCISIGTWAVVASSHCLATSVLSASSYLKWCAGNADNAISPTNGGDGVTSIKALIKSVAKTVISFGALFAIGAIVFSGIQYTTSYGDDEKVKKAKTTWVYAIIGLFLLLLAFPLVDILVNFVYGLS